jgi:hypothetical protein
MAADCTLLLDDKVNRWSRPVLESANGLATSAVLCERVAVAVGRHAYLIDGGINGVGQKAELTIDVAAHQRRGGVHRQARERPVVKLPPAHHHLKLSYICG